MRIVLQNTKLEQQVFSLYNSVGCIVHSLLGQARNIKYTKSMMVTAAKKTKGHPKVVYTTGDLGVYGPSRLILGGHKNNNKEGAKYTTCDKDPLL